jgi:hypothetical protein
VPPEKAVGYVIVKAFLALVINIALVVLVLVISRAVIVALAIPVGR